MSHTYPGEAHQLKIGTYVMLQGHPCKLTSVKISKTGKHGSAKCNVVGKDVLTSKQYNAVFPGHMMVQLFDLDKKEYELTNIDEKEGYVEVMDDVGTNVQFPLETANDVHDSLIAAFQSAAFQSGPKAILVTIVTAPEGETEPELRSVVQSWKEENLN